MTTWVWIIGIIAVAWPVVVAFYLNGAFTNHLNLIAERSEKDHLSDFRAKGTQEEIIKLQELLEKQDALIAALWENAFGLHGDGYQSKSTLPRHLGIKPEWYPFEREWGGPVVYLNRNSAYPWGTYAKSLYIPE